MIFFAFIAWFVESNFYLIPEMPIFFGEAILARKKLVDEEGVQYL